MVGPTSDFLRFINTKIPAYMKRDDVNRNFITFQVHALNTRSGIYLPLHVHFVRNASCPSRYTLYEGSSSLDHSHKIQITFHTKEDAIVIFLRLKPVRPIRSGLIRDVNGPLNTQSEKILKGFVFGPGRGPGLDLHLKSIDKWKWNQVRVKSSHKTISTVT